MPLAGGSPLHGADRSVQSGGRFPPPHQFVKWLAPRRRRPRPSRGTWPLEAKPSWKQAVSFQEMNLLESESTDPKNHTTQAMGLLDSNPIPQPKPGGKHPAFGGEVYH